MSGAAAQDGVSAGAASTPDSPRDPPSGGGPGKGRRRGPNRGTLITIIGGLITAGIAVGVVRPDLIGGKSGVTGIEEPDLSPLPPSDITPALPTLDPSTSKAAVEDAKNCKAPLAWVTIVQRPGGRGGMVRIRSGSYLSPPIQVTNVPQRIALPYPSPYPTGHGVLSLVGDADEVWFQLNPGWFIPTLKGVASINVHWKVGNPCG